VLVALLCHRGTRGESLSRMGERVASRPYRRQCIQSSLRGAVDCPGAYTILSSASVSVCRKAAGHPQWLAILADIDPASSACSAFAVCSTTWRPKLPSLRYGPRPAGQPHPGKPCSKAPLFHRAGEKLFVDRAARRFLFTARKRVRCFRHRCSSRYSGRRRARPLICSLAT
jgi:hypothetical protein